VLPDSSSPSGVAMQATVMVNEPDTGAMEAEQSETETFLDTIPKVVQALVVRRQAPSRLWRAGCSV
jgi:hypothetical protein